MFFRLATILCVLSVASTGCNKTGVAESVTSPTDSTTVSQTDKKETSEASEDTSGQPGSPKTSETNTDIGPSIAVDQPRDESKRQAMGQAKGEAKLVSFDDLKLGMGEDVKFRPVMLNANDGKVKDLFGKRVIVAGYMDPTDAMTGVDEFILLRNLDCKFGPGGQADHLVRIYLNEKDKTSFTDKIVYVEGTLTLNPFPEDPQTPVTYSIYDMTDAKVSLRRPPRAR